MIKNRGELERLRGAGVLLDALEAALAAADPYGAVARDLDGGAKIGSQRSAYFLREPIAAS